MLPRPEGEQRREAILGRSALLRAFLDTLYETDHSKWSQTIQTVLLEVLEQMQERLSENFINHNIHTLVSIGDALEIFYKEVPEETICPIIFLVLALGYELGSGDNLEVLGGELGDRLTDMGFYACLHYDDPVRIRLESEIASRFMSGMIRLGICWRKVADDRPSAFTDFIDNGLDLSGI